VTPTAALRGSALFKAIPEMILGDLSRLMTPVSYGAGDTVFRQGDAGHHLVLLDSGRLEAVRAAPGGRSVQVGTFGPGDVVGELSLLGNGVRMATVHAVLPTNGWCLERVAFDVLRHELRHEALAVAGAIGRLAVQRLADLYARIGAELRGAPVPAPWAHPGGPEPTGGMPDAAYLLTTLFFRDFTPGEVAAVAERVTCRAVARGGAVEALGQLPDALWIVARGAVETTLRSAGASRRLRLAGPGRAVGHMGLLNDARLVERRESRARERTILLEVPWDVVHDLLGAQDRASRKFATALWTDTVRALEHAQRPVPNMTARAHGSLDREPVVRLVDRLSA
jgi:CRP-like cAMP-binding protein